MGYKCEVDQINYNDKPVRVVMKRREVHYHHNAGITVGHETVQEVLCHPDNVDVLGNPITIPGIKHIDQYIKGKRFRHPAVPEEYDRDDA